MKQNLKTALKHPLSFLLRIFILLSAAITIGVLLYIIIFIVAKGAPHLSLDLFGVCRGVLIYVCIVTFHW